MFWGLKGTLMKPAITALLLSAGQDTLATLDRALERQGINTRRARTLSEVSELLAAQSPPHVIFTDRALPDGTWEDVLALAAGSPAPTNVIVVERLANVRFYIEVIEHGAFDFITPPFSDAQLAHVVQCAADNARSRREALSR